MKIGRRFAHRHNGLFLFIFTGIIIAACVPLIMMSFERGGYHLLWLALYGAVLAFLVWLLIIRRSYTFEEDHLVVAVGPAKRRYEYGGITRVRYIKGTRLRVPGFMLFYKGREKFSVQPAEAEAFYEELKKKCPDAEYEM